MAKKLDISKMQARIKADVTSSDVKRIIHCRVLIVCEGEKTEPNYFKSFGMMKTPCGKVLNVECEGMGNSPGRVVDKAIKLKKQAEDKGLPYDAVWAVFDRDSFAPAEFNNAIEKAETNGVGCAWSNEAFELWYVYHFDDRSTAMSRSEYQNVITRRVSSACHIRGSRQFTYEKNSPNMRKVLSECGCTEEEAIRRAMKQDSSFTDKRYHSHNPCTTVYKLVNLLLGKDAEFNKRVENDMA